MNKTFVTIARVTIVTIVFVTIAMNFVTIANAEDAKPPMNQQDAEWLMRMNHPDFNQVMGKAYAYTRYGKSLDQCMLGFPSNWWRTECLDFGYKYWEYQTKLDKLTK